MENNKTLFSIAEKPYFEDNTINLDLLEEVKKRMDRATWNYESRGHFGSDTYKAINYLSSQSFTIETIKEELKLCFDEFKKNVEAIKEKLKNFYSSCDALGVGFRQDIVAIEGELIVRVALVTVEQGLANKKIARFIFNKDKTLKTQGWDISETTTFKVIETQKIY